MSQKVSVYITSYNQKDYLIEAIESVLNQTLPPDQIIIVDDCSDDGSRDIITGYISRYPSLITGIYHDSNKGITQTRIDALKAVTGDFVTFLDGDDRFLPGKIEHEVNLLTKNPDVQIAFSNHYYISVDGSRVGIWAEEIEPPQGNIFCQVFALDFPKRELFRSELVNFHAWKQIGFPDTRFYIYQNYDMKIRLTKQLKTAYTNELLSEYRIGLNGMSSARASVHLANLEGIVKKNEYLLRDIPIEQRNQVRHLVDDFLGQIAKRAMQQTIKSHGYRNNRFNAMRYYLKTIKCQHDRVDYRVILKLLLLNRAYDPIDFYGWDEETGIGSEEGPFPEWNLPVVRWGMGPHTELHFKSKGGLLMLSMICGPHHLRWQRMKVFLNGVQVHQQLFDNDGKFHQIHMSLKTCTGKNLIVLKYETWDKTDSIRPLALLFKQLKIETSTINA
ncbi:MAG: glycosyltransferase [Candidatus Scalindua sp.]|nr:glycosyltransferase [Candidatus Scalindua sp.]